MHGACMCLYSSSRKKLADSEDINAAMYSETKREHIFAGHCDGSDYAFVIERHQNERSRIWKMLELLERSSKKLMGCKRCFER